MSSFTQQYFGTNHLSLTEMKVLLWISDHIRHNLHPKHLYKLSLVDFSRRAGRKYVKYAELKNDISTLAKQNVTITTGALSFELPLFQRIVIPAGSAEFTIELNPAVEVIFTRINKIVNTSEITRLLRVESIYTAILYILIRDQIWSGEQIPLQQLRTLMGLEDKYPRYANLKARVLSPAIKELEQNFGVKLKMEEITEGKMVKAVVFYATRLATHIELNVNHEYFYDDVKALAADAGIALSYKQYSKWIRHGEYAIVAAIEYIRQRNVLHPIPYISKLLDTGYFGLPLNGLTVHQYQFIYYFLENFRDTTALTPSFVIEQKFMEESSSVMSQEEAKQVWILAREKVNKDILNFMSINRSRKASRRK
ncbi:protein involved in initiation of plasmid replication (plasmid) [Thermobacillus composti KWC4]|uniref:Protein involved in initiation of plasmid replication n=1 Tax=Thermobacillus composti (strain DSM 18247 / JCM 13945 / KWC4) TaxID=717605 RepID=L0EJW2_THECK|nr:replication initiation protein [Thermobacillus composti]AGA59969.1 protein involved in initiation of plasmid replication [Thermobacillus composti KWC4]